MNATISMDGLWTAIQSLSLSKRKWLSGKLIENIREQEDEQYISKQEVLAGIDAGLKDLKAGRMQDAWELLKELKDEGYN